MVIFLPSIQAVKPWWAAYPLSLVSLIWFKKELTPAFNKRTSFETTGQEGVGQWQQEK
jgi:hypothetical protein